MSTAPYGKKVVELKPSEEGVTEALIAMLHQDDDDKFDEQRCEDYHIPVRYNAYEDGNGEDADDRNVYLVDNDANPETMFMEALARAEESGKFMAIWGKLLPQQQVLIKKKVHGRTNVDIAEEEGVTEVAIRNRLTKIKNKFESLR